MEIAANNQASLLCDKRWSKYFCLTVQDLSIIKLSFVHEPFFQIYIHPILFKTRELKTCSSLKILLIWNHSHAICCHWDSEDSHKNMNKPVSLIWEFHNRMITMTCGHLLSMLYIHCSWLLQIKWPSFSLLIKPLLKERQNWWSLTKGLFSCTSYSLPQNPLSPKLF